MNTYYCHNCASINGYLRPPPIGDQLTNNGYQLGKYMKHTIPSSSNGYKTVFTGITSNCYQDYIITAVASGHVQLDSQNRVNIVWVGSENTGIALDGGRIAGNMSAVKVVCHSDTNKIHGYPIDVSELNTATCVQCGKAIPY